MMAADPLCSNRRVRRLMHRRGDTDGCLHKEWKTTRMLMQAGWCIGVERLALFTVFPDRAGGVDRQSLPEFQ